MVLYRVPSKPPGWLAAKPGRTGPQSRRSSSWCRKLWGPLSSATFEQCDLGQITLFIHSYIFSWGLAYRMHGSVKSISKIGKAFLWVSTGRTHKHQNIHQLALIEHLLWNQYYCGNDIVKTTRSSFAHRAGWLIWEWVRADVPEGNKQELQTRTTSSMPPLWPLSSPRLAEPLLAISDCSSTTASVPTDKTVASSWSS